MNICREWLLLSAVLPLACAGSEASEPVDRAAVRLEVRRGDLSVRTLVTGELKAEDSTPFVVPNVNIWPLQVRWLMEDGSEVRAGERVVEFDNSQLVSRLEEQRVQAIEASLRLASTKAQAQSDEVQSRFDLAERRAQVEKARLEAEVPRAVLADVTYERRQLDRERAEIELAEAERKLEARRAASRAEIEIQRIALGRARAEAQRAERNLERLVLRSPRAGILLVDENGREDRPFQNGDNVYPGRTVARLPDLTTLFVRARLFDVDDGRIARGMPAVAVLDAFPDRTVTGRVREIDPIAQQASGRSSRRAFQVTIDLDSIDVERMRPGMSVKAVIDQTLEDVLVAPRASLAWSKGEARARRADGSWAPVELGACGTTECVVVGGLEEGAALGSMEGGR